MIGHSVWGKDPKAVPPIYVPREQPLPPPPLPPPMGRPPVVVQPPAVVPGKWPSPMVVPPPAAVPAPAVVPVPAVVPPQPVVQTAWSNWDGSEWNDESWNGETWQYESYQAGYLEQQAAQQVGQQVQHSQQQQHGGAENLEGQDEKGASSDDMEDIPVEEPSGSIAPKAMPTGKMRPKEPAMPPPSHLYTGAYKQLLQTLGFQKKP